MTTLSAILAVIGLALIFHALHRRGQQPPGRMGFPVLMPALAGQTLMVIAIVMWIIAKVTS